MKLKLALFAILSITTFSCFAVKVQMPSKDVIRNRLESAFLSCCLLVRYLDVVAGKEVESFEVVIAVDQMISKRLDFYEEYHLNPSPYSEPAKMHILQVLFMNSPEAMQELMGIKNID